MAPAPFFGARPKWGNDPIWGRETPLPAPAVVPPRVWAVETPLIPLPAPPRVVQPKECPHARPTVEAPPVIKLVLRPNFRPRPDLVEQSPVAMPVASPRAALKSIAGYTPAWLAEPCARVAIGQAPVAQANRPSCAPLVGQAPVAQAMRPSCAPRRQGEHNKI